MNIVTSGAIAALFIGSCMGATLKPSQSIASHVQQAPRLVIEKPNTGLLASAELIKHSAG